MNPTTEKLMTLANEYANAGGVIESAQKQQALRLAIDALLTPPAWPIRGARVEGDTVIVTVKGGNDAARWLCGELVALIDRPTLSLDDYNARAIPRLAAIDALSAKIDFSSFAWRNTPEGERWQRLMDEQGRDEVEAGL